MTAPDPLDAALLCPACGFDLRGTESDRCGECGLAIDREALRESGIPWAHRRKIGRVKAYWKTLWQILLDRRSLRHESARPQDMKDGRAFRRVTAGFVAMAFVGLFVVVVY